MSRPDPFDLFREWFDMAQRTDLPEPAAATLATVGADGAFRVPDVPAGAYTVRLWSKRWLPFAQPIAVTATGDVAVTIAAGR